MMTSTHEECATDGATRSPSLHGIGGYPDSPLSLAQEALWLLTQFDGANRADIFYSATRLRGPLVAPLLERCLRALVAHHSGLRTVFRSDADTPIQHVLPADEAAASFSLRQAPLAFAEEDSDSLTQRVEALICEPFALDRELPFRALCLRVESDDHILVLAAHHLVADGTSFGIIHRDLAALYAAGGNPSVLPDPPSTPIELARRERMAAASGDWKIHRSYWKDRLANVQDLALPTDFERPTRTSYDGRTLAVPIPDHLDRAVRALSRHHHTSRFRVYLAAFQALLVRLSDLDDFAVGIPVTGRRDAAQDGVIGHFVNTLAIPVPKNTADLSFASLLQHTAETVDEALTHDAYPFELVVSDLARQRDPGRNPVYQTSFALLGNRREWMKVDLEGLTCTQVPLLRRTSLFDLGLTVTDDDRGCYAAWEYRTDLFAADTIRHFAQCFLNLLDAAVASPERAVGLLPLLDDPEQRQVIDDFNNTSTPSLMDEPVHVTFRRWALSTPDAVALRWAGKSMSYAELDARAERWGQSLRDAGVGPESLVGLCMPRSFAEVAALLAILKAGGAFLPLASDTPEARLSTILEDSRPTVILTQKPLTEMLLRAAPWATVLTMPEDGSEGAEPAGPPVDAVRPEHLAYVLYTSWSTGRPKGAQIEHRSLSNFVNWMVREMAASVTDIALQNISPAFDASLWVFFVPLTCGARIVLAEPQTQRDMRQLQQLMQQERISLPMFVPSVLRVFLDEIQKPNLDTLRYMVCGGEALDPALVRRFFSTCPGARIGNFYGPTEATVVTTAIEVQPSHVSERSISIGRPIANMRTYVLDTRLQPQPIGVVGELCISGVGVARGYLNQPELTAERFVPDPFHPGERMYRSGDLARWRPDGTLEFLGRTDHQIKLRGLRIELGDVEAALSSAPGVRAATVVVRGANPETQRLVGYVQADVRDAQMLRESLKQHLPAYMVPSAYVFLDELPRLPSGKVDRKALPESDGMDEESAASPLSPRSPLESSLLEIWQSVLHRARIGVHDDFFALGGNSLHATQVASQIRASLDIDLELRVLFEQTTLADLAREIQERIEGGVREVAEPVGSVPRDGALPVSFSQRRMWIEHQMDPLGAAYNVSVALRLHGPLDKPALLECFGQLVKRHEAFRTRFTFASGEPFAIVDPVAPVVVDDMTGADCTAPGLDEARAYVAQRAAEPFDLEHGPLYRFVLACIGPEDHLLSLTMHHIVTDGWSASVVLNETAELYRNARRGLPLQLPPKTFDFVDYAAWQRRYIGGPRLQAQMTYWVERLRGMTPLALPTDTGTSTRRGTRGDLVRIHLSDAWIEDLQRQSARLGATPFMVLLAAFQSLLGRWCAQDDVAIGFPIANRTRVESEEVVGSLVNTLVMRTRIEDSKSFRTFLRDDVREAVLGAYMHQDLPYDDLINQLRESGLAGKDPGIRVLFNVLNTPMVPPVFDGLEADYLDLDLGSTQFDLSMSIDATMHKLLVLQYSTELFTRESIEDLGELFLHGISQALQTPDTPLRSLWTAPRSQLTRIGHWNATTTPLPTQTTATVTALLEKMRNHDGIALRDAGGRSLRYRELWDAVERLAHVLRARGARRGTLVGLGVERGIDMVVAQLAVLRSGAAYVPLDPNYPAARLRDMIDDAGLVLLVSTSSLRSVWGNDTPPLLELDTIGKELSAAPAAPPAPDAQRDARPDDPAYVIYTSGSTGKPKGVVVPHGAVVNFLVSMRHEPGLGTDDVLLAVTTLSFDIAVLELLLPLSTGACVAIASYEETTDGGTLRARLEAEATTVMQATPATWRMLFDAGWPGKPGFKALVGGEALGPALAREMLAHCSEVWNMYGPTETTVWSTCWQVKPAEPIRIGQPIANTQVHVLDTDGSPCPIGFAGEIHIGGEGVTTGYLNRAELTAERFVPDPFSSTPTARMYKTGDRGRWCSNGLLEHQGRLDFQVKLRGYRIELGEIESHLLAHPDVGQALAIVREDTPGDARLCAYVVPKHHGIDQHALRDHLRGRIPAYMIPQHIVPLDTLPRLPNGKINRASLPVPREETTVTSTRSGGQPSTDAEQALARIWADLLGYADIRLEDNFFDLGGHSLLANQVVVRFAEATGHRLALRRMVHENLAQLAAGVSVPIRDASPVPQSAKPSGLLSKLFGRSRAG